MASLRYLHLLKFFLPISIIIWTSTYLLTSSRYTSFPNPSWAKHEENGESQNPIPNDSQGDVADRKAAFIQEASEWEIDGPFNNTALHNLCASKKWVQGLHFKCAPAYGGVGNVRNIVLTCVRYAIEAGATTLLVPDIIARDADLIHLETANNMPYTYMFDLDVFNTSLTSACPQIRLVTPEADLAEYPSIAKPAALAAKDLGHDFKVSRVLDFPTTWRAAFDKWLKEFGAPGGFSASSPLLVALAPAFFEFPIKYDSPDFIATFGRIVQFNKDLRRLAGVVLYALDKKYTLGIDPGAVGIPAAKKFYGAHLRTDVDAIAASFASYEEQSTAYLSGAQANKLPFIYLASGSKLDIERFTSDASALKIAVTTKNALLEGDTEFASALAEMQKLTWDQQALIDYAILVRSSHFGGTWASSFAWNTVFRRHVVVGKGTWIHSQAAINAKRDLDVRDDKLAPGECYRDVISTIYGPEGMGIWFELSMWP